MPTYKNVLTELKSHYSPEQAQALQRFFKTGKGEYGEGDVFLGIPVPEIRKISKQYINLNHSEVEKLLHQQEHEARMCALLILIQQTKQPVIFPEIVQLYLRNTTYINNRDLVDLSAPQIIGAYFFDKDRSPVYQLANSSFLREKRIAIISTFDRIKKGEYQDTFAIAEILLHDPHDLVQKAVGRMLREV